MGVAAVIKHHFQLLKTRAEEVPCLTICLVAGVPQAALAWWAGGNGGRYRCATPWSLRGLVQGLRGLLRLYDLGVFQESRGGFEGVAFPATACWLMGPL